LVLGVVGLMMMHDGWEATYTLDWHCVVYNELDTLCEYLEIVVICGARRCGVKSNASFVFNGNAEQHLPHQGRST